MGSKRAYFRGLSEQQPFFDLDPRYGITLNAGKVQAIQDQSGFLIGAQPIASAMPELVTQAVSGKPVLKFSGAQFLDFGDVLDVRQRTWAIYVIGTSTAASGSFIAKSVAANVANRWGVVYDNNTLSLVYHDTLGRTTSAVPASKVRKIITGTFSRALVLANSLYFNGVFQQAAYPDNPAYDMNSTFRLLVGAYGNATDTGVVLPLNGEIERILIFPRHHSAQMVAAMSQKLANDYNITL